MKIKVIQTGQTFLNDISISPTPSASRMFPPSVLRHAPTAPVMSLIPLAFANIEDGALSHCALFDAKWFAATHPSEMMIETGLKTRAIRSAPSIKRNDRKWRM